MRTTIDLLSTLLTDGMAIRERLKTEYFDRRRNPDFRVDQFVDQLATQVGSWRYAVEQCLQRGFSSPVPHVTFCTAPVSPIRQVDTNIRWGNLLAGLSPSRT